MRFYELAKGPTLNQRPPGQAIGRQPAPVVARPAATTPKFPKNPNHPSNHFLSGASGL
jgi:hypothetical protein